jgi:hypothetical protein
VTTAAQGSTIPFNAILSSPNGPGTDVTLQAIWSTSNASVATVPTNGTTTAQGPGTATITATYGGLTDSKDITVSPITVPVINAPPLDTAGVPDFESAVRFLYTGANAVQTGVAAGAIQTFRAGTFTGTFAIEQGMPSPELKSQLVITPSSGRPRRVPTALLTWS